MSESGEYITFRMRVTDARKAQLQIAETGAAVKGLSKEVDRYGVAAHEAEGRTWLMNQAMFTLRRFAYSATLAVVALGGASVFMGLQFDATMENNTVAMTHFLGSTGAAKKELGSLYQLAAKTPFEFTQLADAARKFLAFGFSVKQTNSYLKVLGDTSAGLALGADGIDRAVLAIGQMQAKGKVMGDEILQLTELGIPALKILQEQLHLTDAQVARIGQTGLKSSVAIPALMAGLNKMFGGSAKEQAKTMQGQLSSLHDYTSHLLGDVMMPLFDYLRKSAIPTLAKTAQTVDLAFQKGGFDAAARSLDKSFGTHGVVSTGFIAVKNIIVDLAKIWQNVLWPTLKDTATIYAPPLVAILWALSQILGLLAAHTTILRYVIEPLISYFIALKVVTATLIAIEAIQTSILWLQITAMGWLESSTILATIADWAWVTSLYAASSAMWLLNAAMYANPIGLIILAVVALIAGMIYLYFHWKRFHDAVDATYNFIKNDWPLIGAIILAPVLGPLAVLIIVFETVRRKLQDLYAYALKVWDVIVAPLNFVKGGLSGDATNASGGRFHGVHGYQGAAAGGSVMSSGWGWVGENGPELRYLPRGAQIAPLSSRPLNMAAMSGVVTVVVQSVLDGKVIAESTAKVNQDKRARQ